MMKCNKTQEEEDEIDAEMEKLSEALDNAKEILDELKRDRD